MHFSAYYIFIEYLKKKSIKIIKIEQKEKIKQKKVTSHHPMCLKLLKLTGYELVLDTAELI